MKLLAYKIRPNEDGKTEYVEFVTVIKNWKDKFYFEICCKKTDYTPVFFPYDRKAKKDYCKFYENKIKEIFKDWKENPNG